VVDGGLAGALTLSRGGINGTIGLAARPQGQAFDVELTARDARFGGATPLTLAQATVDLRGFVGSDDTTIEGTMRAAGIGYGDLFLGRMAADAAVRNGRGTFNAALAGRRGSRFELLLNGAATQDQITLAARGSYAGQAITMPRRAVLQRQGNGGWLLEQTQLTYGAGSAVASGRFGGGDQPEGRLALFNMPIGLADVMTGELGVDGTVSGIVDYAENANGLPTGEARLRATGVTRSGLMLTSRPLEVAGVISLSPSLLQARGVVEDGGRASGRLDAQISGLPGDGTLIQRLYRGDLFAQLRYDGPAEALWRVLAIDLIDLSGNVDVAANVRGTLGNPQVRGSLSGDDMRLQAALTGTDISGLAARGRFDGSRLQLTSFSGTASNGGRVSGSGFIDFSNISRDTGPQLDIRVAARNARILRLPGMSATVTGPLRFVSDGINGTIAGRLEVRDASWQLGEAEQQVLLPDVAITEINQPADTAPRRRAAQPWRFLIDAHAPRGIAVDGMGLDSEWSGDLRLRGTTADPRIGGGVSILQRQGYYTFAGVRFAITRGRIDFDENVAPDPRLDIFATSNVNGLTVNVAVRGNALRPEIVFSSVPALPEEELMARMLFGGSITELSATDALQLGAALASLRGGAGLDPINRLRSAIGLDRLRIVPADTALGRGTAVALGENITRRFYIELITDGQGYNATQLEYRVSGWLSLLASLNTLGRGSLAAEVSRDY
jgi:translocation and assembly module TamB